MTEMDEEEARDVIEHLAYLDECDFLRKKAVEAGLGGEPNDGDSLELLYRRWVANPGRAPHWRLMDAFTKGWKPPDDIEIW
jgi:hypothetical protein